MYYNKYLLFSPDDYGDGGDSGDDGGVDGEVNPDDDGGSSGSGDPLYSETAVYMGGNIKKSTTITAGKKYIRSLHVQDSEILLSANGDSRDIKVVGTPGSGFNLEVNDSSGCSILEESLNQVEIPKNGVYKLRQSFPDISTSAQGGLIKEHYDIILTPNADARYDTDSIKVLVDILENENSTEEEIRKTVAEYVPQPPPDFEIGKPITLYQYPDVTVTVTNSSSQTGPALSVSGANVTQKSRASTEGGGMIEYTLVVTEDSSTAGYFYVNGGSFNKALTTSTMLKKVVSRPVNEFSEIQELILKPLTTRTDENGNITGDLVAGMKIYGKIEKTKIVTESLEVPTCKRKTDKFSLSDTVGLFPGMTINIPGESSVELVSVDCAKNITIDRKIAIRENREIVLKYEVWSSVSEIKTQINNAGETCITTSDAIRVVDGMELEFDDNASQVSGTFRFSGSGSNTVTLVSLVEFSRFGLHDVTYTWNLDDFITRKPNARDYTIDAPKNTLVTVNLQHGDYDANASSKTQSITRQPSHGTVDAGDAGIITYLADKGYAGDDEILYTTSDGTTTSEEKRITITVK